MPTQATLSLSLTHTLGWRLALLVLVLADWLTLAWLGWRGELGWWLAGLIALPGLAALGLLRGIPQRLWLRRGQWLGERQGVEQSIDMVAHLHVGALYCLLFARPSGRPAWAPLMVLPLWLPGLAAAERHGLALALRRLEGKPSSGHGL